MCGFSILHNLHEGNFKKENNQTDEADIHMEVPPPLPPPQPIPSSIKEPQEERGRAGKRECKTDSCIWNWIAINNPKKSPVVRYSAT